MARVLIIDACNASRELAAELLEQCGHDVLQMAGAENSLAVLAAAEFDLILMHPSARPGDDDALLRPLQAATFGRGIALLAWTDSPEQVVWLNAAGACGVVPRLTGSLDLLVGMVEQALLSEAGSGKLRAALRVFAAMG